MSPSGLALVTRVLFESAPPKESYDLVAFGVNGVDVHVRGDTGCVVAIAVER